MERKRKTFPGHGLVQLKVDFMSADHMSPRALASGAHGNGP